MTNCTALVPVFPFSRVPKHPAPLSWLEAIPQAIDHAMSYDGDPSVLPLRDRRRFGQGVLYHQGGSQRTFSQGKPAKPWIRSNLLVHGTYTMDGELVVPVGEKGVFLDCLG